jgi:hypothetical protein
MKWLAGLLLVVLGLSACGNPCDTDYEQQCQTQMATGVSMDGKIVFVPVTTCFCVEQVGT